MRKGKGSEKGKGYYRLLRLKKRRHRESCIFLPWKIGKKKKEKKGRIDTRKKKRKRFEIQQDD